MHIFTITAGRTGTAWMANFIGANLQIPSVHEFLGVDDFGTRMPDIRTMRHFNEIGMTPLVSNFWKRKLESIKLLPNYCETNHTLTKCGLIEYLHNSNNKIDCKFLLVRRNWIDLAISYINRSAFANKTTIWQWNLDPSYKNKIVEFDEFKKFGQLGPILWYFSEIETRQEYYKKLYESSFSFLDIQMEDVVTSDGARNLLRELGREMEPVLPKKVNQSRQKTDDKLRDQIGAVVSKVSFDPGALAASFIADGRRLEGCSTTKFQEPMDSHR